MQRASQAGFTLLELMVAMALFALIGLGAQAMLSSVIRTREAGVLREEQLARLQTAVAVIEQDLAQSDPSSLALSAGGYDFRFIRNGWQNPLHLARSDLVMIGYRGEEGGLYRYRWQAGVPIRQLLLAGAAGFTARIRPRCVEINFTTPVFGPTRRVIEVPDQ